MRTPPPARSPPGCPQDVTAAELLQRLSVAAGEELLFLQLPDTLPGQPPSQDSKPGRAELQSDDGQLLLVKQEKGQVRAAGGFGVGGRPAVPPPHSVCPPPPRRPGRRTAAARWRTSPRGSWANWWCADPGGCSWCWAG